MFRIQEEEELSTHYNCGNKSSSATTTTTEEAELDGAENMLPHNDDVKEDIVPMHSHQEGSDTSSKNIHVPEDRSTMIIRHHSSILTSRGTLRADADNDIVAFVPQMRTSSLHTGPLSTLTAGGDIDEAGGIIEIRSDDILIQVRIVLLVAMLSK